MRVCIEYIIYIYIFFYIYLYAVEIIVFTRDVALALDGVATGDDSHTCVNFTHGYLTRSRRLSHRDYSRFPFAASLLVRRSDRDCMIAPRTLVRGES